MIERHDVLSTDPDVLGGTPVFRGTRVPVRVLLEHLSDGGTVASFLDDYPTVSEDQARAVLALAREALTAGAGST